MNQRTQFHQGQYNHVSNVEINNLSNPAELVWWARAGRRGKRFPFLSWICEMWLQRLCLARLFSLLGFEMRVSDVFESLYSILKYLLTASPLALLHPGKLARYVGPWDNISDSQGTSRTGCAYLPVPSLSTAFSRQLRAGDCRPGLSWGTARGTR